VTASQIGRRLGREERKSQILVVYQNCVDDALPLSQLRPVNRLLTL
jgi:hypothetical protein